MYNQSYDDYLRSILGYSNPMMNQPYGMQDDYFYDNRQIRNQNMYGANTYQNLENFYPDTYRMMYPMVIKAINVNNKPINEETINAMVDDIYISFETEENNRSNNDSKDDTKEKQENRGERNNNPLLRDIIKILLIKELLNRPQFNPGRPPFDPGRPPFDPGRPGMPPRPRMNDMY